MTERLKYLSLAAASLSAVSLQAQERPNIILFMVDDMGWQDTSVPFWSELTANNCKYETPNMEALAAKGMKFTQAYASSISSPSRCSLITGMNAARHRVTNWTLEKDKTTDIESDSILPPQWNLNGIPQAEGIPNTFRATSFVQLLRDNGYHTIHCGKAHFGAIDTPGEDPAHFGFEVNIAGHAGGGPATYLSELNFGHNGDGTPVSLFAIPGLEKYWGKGVFATEALTLEALSALDDAKAQDRPFFLYMSHYAVHVPIDRDPRYYDKYLIIEDFFPSILEMAGIDSYKTLSPIDGRSFVPLIKGTGDPSKGRSLVWNYPNIWGNSGPGVNLNCAIRRGDWKLVYYYDTGKKELFNVKEDIGETCDLSAEKPGLVRKLSARLGRYLRSVDAQRPSFLPSGEPCPWPDGR